MTKAFLLISAHLYMAFQLQEDAGLACKEELPELELGYHARLEHSVPCLPPGRRQQLRLIIALPIPTCRMHAFDMRSG